MNPYRALYFKNDRIKASLLLVVAAVVYLPFLNNPLFFDDYPLFSSIILPYTDSHFDFNLRWFPYTTLGITWVFAGEQPLVYRAQNFLLHAMNVLLLLLVMRLWISLFVAEPARRQMANWGAWMGALIFACHPLAVYGTGYLVQRSILMATMFTLVMHLAYFRGLLDGDKRFLALAVAAYFVAAFSKEHSLTAPAIMLLMTWVLRDKMHCSRRALLMTWLGFLLIAIIAVMRTQGILGKMYEIDAPVLFGDDNLLAGTPMLRWLSVMTQAGLFFKYLLLMLLPNPAWMSIDMREQFVLSLNDWMGWLGLIGFIAYGVIAVICILRGGRRALFGLALLYPWCFFIVEFSTIRVQEIFVLYRAYLWLPGFLLLFPLLLGSLPDRKIIWISTLFALLLIPLSWNRLWVFADEYRLWDDAVVLLHGKEPMGAPRVYYGRGYAAEKKKNWDSAIDDFKHSLRINSVRPHVNLALAGAYAQSGRHAEALAEYDKIIKAYPDNAKAHYNKALLLNMLNEHEQSAYHMQKSCALGKNEACLILELTKSRNNRTDSPTTAKVAHNQ